MEILGSIRTQIFFLYLYSRLYLYFVLFGQLRISGRNRAAPRRTFVHISTSSCNPRGRPYIYLLFDDYTQIFSIPRRRGHVFVICLCVYCSATKTLLKNSNIVIAWEISHSLTVSMCDGQAWSISIELASAFDETSKNDASNLGRQQIQRGSWKKKKRNWSKT